MMKKCLLCGTKMVLNKNYSKAGFNLWDCPKVKIDNIICRVSNTKSDFTEITSSHFSAVVLTKCKKYAHSNRPWCRIVSTSSPHILITTDDVFFNETVTFTVLLYKDRDFKSVVFLNTLTIKTKTLSIHSADNLIKDHLVLA